MPVVILFQSLEHLHVILTLFTDATCAALYMLYFSLSALILGIYLKKT